MGSDDSTSNEDEKRYPAGRNFRENVDFRKDVNHTMRGQVLERPKMMIEVGVQIIQMFKEGDTESLKNMLNIYGIGILVTSIIASNFDKRGKKKPHLRTEH